MLKAFIKETADINITILIELMGYKISRIVEDSENFESFYYHSNKIRTTNRECCILRPRLAILLKEIDCIVAIGVNEIIIRKLS